MFSNTNASCTPCPDECCPSNLVCNSYQDSNGFYKECDGEPGHYANMIALAIAYILVLGPAAAFMLYYSASKLLFKRDDVNSTALRDCKQRVFTNVVASAEYNPPSYSLQA